jgi:hypothetical protein
MKDKRRTYTPRIVGDKVMMPADLKRLHKYMREIEHIGFVSDEMREVVEELWPELVHKLPPKRSRSSANLPSGSVHHRKTGSKRKPRGADRRTTFTVSRFQRRGSSR